MNPSLTKYLSDVFRNEVPRDLTPELKKNAEQASPELIDRNINQFLLDKRYSLRLDEII